MATISEALALAFQHLQVGQLQAAEQIYRQILAVEPNQADALHLRGVVAYLMGQHEAAIAYITRAIQLNGTAAVFHSNLGNALKDLGRLDQAVACYRRALELQPDFAGAEYNLGNVLKDQQKLAEAIVCYRQALKLQPDYVEAHNNLGIALQDQGNLDEAVACYRRALELQPDYADAHFNLGNALRDQDRCDQAIACYRRVLELQPDYADAHNNLGNVLRDQEHLDQAIACYRRALELKPACAETHNNLGAALFDQGKSDEAVGCYRRALELLPDYADAHNNLGNVLKDQGHLEQAVACYRRALELKPDFADAHNNLGIAFREQEHLDQAVACYRRALELQPDYADAHNNLGTTLLDLGKSDEAVACYRRALELKPDLASAHNNLGNVFRDRGNLDQAIACYRRALELKPDFAEAHNNLGNVFRDQGNFDQAAACYRKSLELKPDFAEAHVALALLRLLTGDWRTAWPEYEWRWQRKGVLGRHFPQPTWNGESLVAKTIFLHAEQGLGDTLQFIRYAAIVKRYGGTVLVGCQEALLRLLEGFPGIDRLVGPEDELPAFDVHAPLLSVPRIVKTSLETIPAWIPCAFSPPTLLQRWQERLRELDGFKIAIAWQGNPQFRQDRFRSIPLRCFAPLAELPGVRLISLQKGLGAEQLAEVANLFPVTSFADEWDQQAGPFMDTAAVMKTVDLVITSDTVTAHLAGTLGVPVWVALCAAADWRWLLDRADSPWYPTMRLFRQRKLGNWQDVFTDMSRALLERLSKHDQPRTRLP